MVLVPLVSPGQGECEVADRVRARRSPGGLLEIDQVMLNSPPMADGWNTLLGAVRGSTALSASVRELLILRTTYLLDAAYEYKPHVEIGASAGLTKQQLDFTRRDDNVSTEEVASIYPDELHALAYELAQESTVTVKISTGLLIRLKRSFDPRALVEAFTVVAAYNFTSRIVVGLDVEEASKVKAGLL